MDYGDNHGLSKVQAVVPLVFVLSHKLITIESSTSAVAYSLQVFILDKINNSIHLAHHDRS